MDFSSLGYITGVTTTYWILMLDITSMLGGLQSNLQPGLSHTTINHNYDNQYLIITQKQSRYQLNQTQVDQQLNQTQSNQQHGELSSTTS